jgi:hypothetical protein
MTTYPVTCEVCGEGVFACKHLAYLSVRHRDPAICAENLRHQRIELEKREGALNKAEGK